MSKPFLRAALVGCAAAVASAQTPAPTPIHVQPPVPTMAGRAVPPAPAKTVLKTFDVADLVCPPADSPLAKPGTDPAMVAAAKAFAEVRSEDLMKVLRVFETHGSPMRVEVTTDGKSLVVNGSEAVADKIGECLKSLRTARRSQVKVDMVVFTVPNGNEAMAKLFGDKGAAAVCPDEFNKVLRELKASGAVDILSRPSLMVANRQTGFFQVGQPVKAVGCPATCDTVGLTTRITPAVSADLKSVVLDFDLERTRPSKGNTGVDCQQTRTSMVVPDGRTMAVKVCTETVELKTEVKVPVVGDIPYLGRLFRTVGVISQPTDTVAVVTVTRVADAPCVAPPPAVTPPMMPTAVPLAAPAPVVLPLPQAVRVVEATDLQRVGTPFTTLTAPAKLPPTPSRQGMGSTLAVYGFKFAESPQVCGGVIGTTLSSEATALMAAYKAACAAGRTEDAARLAIQLLAKDPTCFGK